MLICVDEDTVPVGKNAVTCAELLTVLEGSNALTCVDEDTIPDGVPVNPLYGNVPVNAPLTEPVIPFTFPVGTTSNDPVITAEPLNGNPLPAPAFNAYDAV